MKLLFIPMIILLIAVTTALIVLFLNYRKLKNDNNTLTLNANEASDKEALLQQQYNALIEKQNKLSKNQKHFQKLATTDTLTNLSNRSALMQFLDNFTLSHETPLYLLYIDLDNFKHINDTRGHEVGDMVLIEVSRRLSSFKEDVLFVSRLGGDEFVIVMDESKTTTDDLVHHLMDEIAKGIEKDDVTFHISCSVGISVFPEHGRDKTTLLRKADIAMYHAKNKGKNQHSFFEEAMELEMADKLVIHNNIRNAITSGEFTLYYQPQIDLITGEIYGCEALTRWQDSTGKFVSPAKFIPVAEDEGLIDKVGVYVYRAAAKNAKEWSKKHGVPLHYAVNVSPNELKGTDFVVNFMNILNEFNIDPHYVSIEITENVFIDNVSRTINQLEELRSFGIKVHLDDFGSAYSSLNYLIQLPIDVIKIDKPFMEDITFDIQKMEMARFIIDISHTLDMKVIAEGVETEQQYHLLKALNCDYIQGYYYAKPMDMEELERFVLTQADK